jgi:hypothetical protein
MDLKFTKRRPSLMCLDGQMNLEQKGLNLSQPDFNSTLCGSVKRLIPNVSPSRGVIFGSVSDYQ